MNLSKLISVCLTALCAACSSSADTKEKSNAGSESETQTEQTAPEDEGYCPQVDIEDASFQFKAAVDVAGTDKELQCDYEGLSHPDLSYQNAGIPGRHNYNVVCKSEDTGQRISFWLSGIPDDSSGLVFRPKKPYAEKPNMTFVYQEGDDDVLKEDSFKTAENLVILKAKLVTHDRNHSTDGGKKVHRLKGCLDAEFNATSGLTAGTVKAGFNVLFKSTEE